MNCLLYMLAMMARLFSYPGYTAEFAADILMCDSCILLLNMSQSHQSDMPK